MNRSFLLSAICFLGAAISAQTAPAPVAQGIDIQYNDKQQETDMDALRRWLQDKRLVSLKELGGDLSISGEVRTEAQFTNERQAAHGSSDFIQQRGMNSATGRPSLAWDVEFNLMLDYHTERTWAAMKVEFDNDMGVRSGTVNRVKLEKAYLGGRLIAGNTFTWDAEIGRRYLANVFDSKLQFGSLFDGALFRFGKAFQDIGDFYVNLGAFLVDDRFNQYGEVMEIGALKIANLPLNMRYSIINWYRPFSQEDLGNAPTTATPYPQPVSQPWKYLTNQYTIFYQDYPTWLGKRLIKIYAAGLINPLARGVAQTGQVQDAETQPDGQVIWKTVKKGSKQNLGWYAGGTIGLVKKAGDWAVDANYQWVQAQAVAQGDSTGIGTGNAAGRGFYTVNQNGTGGPTTQATAYSTNNFKGFQVEALYAFTDNLTVQQVLQMSWTLNQNIGQNRDYKQYEVEFIYAF